jgi:hypothetical protein
MGGFVLTQTAAGGTAPYMWSVASGSLPPGLTLSGRGVINGTPTTATAASFTVRVAGSDGASLTKVFDWSSWQQIL